MLDVPMEAKHMAIVTAIVFFFARGTSPGQSPTVTPKKRVQGIAPSASVDSGRDRTTDGRPGSAILSTEAGPPKRLQGVSPSHSGSAEGPMEPNAASPDEESVADLSEKVRRLQRLVEALTNENRILRRRLEGAEHSQ